MQSFVIVIYQFTYGTSLLNHLDVSGDTEVSCLLDDLLSTISWKVKFINWIKNPEIVLNSNKES